MSDIVSVSPCGWYSINIPSVQEKKKAQFSTWFFVRCFPLLTSCLQMLIFIFSSIDLAPAHTAKGTKSWFNYHSVAVLDWPSNCPDLNPIGNLWAVVKRKLRDTRPNNADDLKAAIKATWASITPTHCHGLIGSMPRYILQYNSFQRRPRYSLNA